MARTVSIERSRLPRWLDNFAVRHGEPTAMIDSSDQSVIFTAGDGAESRIKIPFPPLPVAPSDPRRQLVDHVLTDRTVGGLLVRRGGYAVGIFHGEKLIKHKVGTAYVQGKTKAGGWSQQRYARRRGNQARELYERVAAAAETILLPELAGLDAVALGGDRAGVDEVLKTPSLQRIRAVTLPRVYPTDDPRRRVLETFPNQFLAVDIQLNDRA